MVAYATFSPDGSSIATVSFDSTARIWDVKTWQPLFSPLPHVEWLPPQQSKPPVFAVAFSPDGQRVVTGGLDGMLRLWNAATGQPISVRMEHHGQVRRVSFSPDGRFIVSAGFDGAVHFWDAHTGQLAEATLNLHAAAMQASFDSEGRRVATISSAGEVRVWHVTADAPVNVGRATMSGNGERYVTFSENEFRVRNARNDSPLTPPRDAGGIIVTGICNFSGQRIALRTQSEGAGSELIHIFNESGEPLSEFVVPSPGRHWWLNESGTRLITGSEKNVFLWDASNGKLIFGPPKYSGPVQVAAFSPNEKFLAMAIGSNVFVLDPNSGAELLPPFALSQKVKSISFSPDSRWLATGGGEGSFNPAGALIWNLGMGKSNGVSISHADAIAVVNFSHDGWSIATASDDYHAGIWTPSTGKPVFRLLPFVAQVHTAAFSADDRWLLTATYFEAQVWDARTGHAVTPRFVDPSVLSGAGFCAGGKRIWVQSRRGLLFWNLPRENSSPDELIAFTENLGVTVSGSVRGNEAEAALAELRRSCAAARARTDNVEAWHREQEELCEAQGDWFAAQFHLERLSAKTPRDAALRERSEKIKDRLDASLSPVVVPATR